MPLQFLGILEGSWRYRIVFVLICILFAFMSFRWGVNEGLQDALINNAMQEKAAAEALKTPARLISNPSNLHMTTPPPGSSARHSSPKKLRNRSFLRKKRRKASKQARGNSRSNSKRSNNP